MISFTSRKKHQPIKVEDSENSVRTVCICQVGDKHTKEDHVEFPVYECPYYTRKVGFGTEQGIDRN